MKDEDYLASIYYDPKHPGSYSGPTKLLQVVRQEGKHKIGLGRIKKWLSAQETYTLHRSVQHKIKRNKVIVEGLDDQWDMDLMDMTSIAKYNQDYKFVLLAIDIFSRYVWVEALKTKQAKDVLDGLKIIFEKGRIPFKIRTDKGGEFTNGLMKTFLKDKGVVHFVTHNEVKANYAERAIKTIKGRVFKYFSEKQTYKYTDKLQDFVYSYNHTQHRSIKMAPNDVNPANEASLWQQQYVQPYIKAAQKVKTEQTKKKTRRRKKKKFKFKEGDTVRVSFLREPFSREYHQKWSGEVFTITKRFLRKDLPIYRLKDHAGDVVQGTFYQPELQKVIFDKDQKFKVEKVLKTKGKGKNKQSLVRWLHWPSKYDSWVTNLTDL